MRKTKRGRKALLLGSLMIAFPAICFAASDENTHKGESSAATLNSTSAPGDMSALNNSSDPQVPIRAKKGDAGLIGVGIRLSTLGAGAEVGVSLSNKLDVRGGFNIFQYSRGFNHDGIAYKGQLHLRPAKLIWTGIPSATPFT